MLNLIHKARLASRRILPLSARRALLLSFSALLLCELFSACASHPFEETVTTNAARSSALPAGAPSIAITPELPTRDADIENAGDHIANAIMHLDKRRRGGHEEALRALGQAEAAMTRALRAKERDDRARGALHAALKNIEIAERNVQRGASDTLAAKQLSALNKDLDDLTALDAPSESEAHPADDSQRP